MYFLADSEVSSSHEEKVSKIDKSLPEKEVHTDNLPGAVQQNVTYIVKAQTRDSFLRKIRKDMHSYRLKNSTARGCQGVERRVGTCTGSYKCRNENCPFLKYSGGVRGTACDVKSSGGRFCSSCSHVMWPIVCEARKEVEWDENSGTVRVKYTGHHACKQKPPRSRNDDELKKAIQANPQMGPKELATHTILTEVVADNVVGAVVKAESFVDRKRIKALQEQLGIAGKHSYVKNDVVGVAKIKTVWDAWDKYLIFEMGDERYMMGGRSFVFKSAKPYVELMVQLNEDLGEDSPYFGNGTVFFDTCHSRVIHWKSMGLWYYHEAARCMIRLASMEVKDEKAEDVELFFRICNKMVSQYTQEHPFTSNIPPQFNPEAVIVNATGAN